jgi:hypothetical protein
MQPGNRARKLLSYSSALDIGKPSHRELTQGGIANHTQLWIELFDRRPQHGLAAAAALT